MPDEVQLTQASARMLRALVEQAKERRIAAGEESVTNEDVVGDVVTVTPAATTAAGIDEGIRHEEELAAVMGKLLEEGALEPDEGSASARAISGETARLFRRFTRRRIEGRYRVRSQSPKAPLVRRNASS
jgi:hypothetical protein